MSAKHRIVLTILALLGAAAPATAGGRWSIGVNFGVPVYPRPFGYYYYRPYPLYVGPPPLILAPPPVLQEVPVAPPVYGSPAPTTVVRPAPPAATEQAPMPTPLAAQGQADIQHNLQRLADPDERVRAEAALQLGRAKAAQAVDPLAASLAGDGSPAVREAAARGLGLIGSPKALPALRRAAQVDADRDVRHSATFAVDVIQAR